MGSAPSGETTAISTLHGMAESVDHVACELKVEELTVVELNEHMPTASHWMT